MLQITETAARTLKGILSKVTDLEHPCIRFRVTEEGVKIAVDRERPGDTTIKHNGESLIVMNTVTSDRLYDRRLDVEKGRTGLILKQNEGASRDAPPGQ
jgi:hypothetical protein